MKKEKGMLICRTEKGFEFGIKEEQYKEEGPELISFLAKHLMLNNVEAGLFSKVFVETSSGTVEFSV